MNEISNIAKFLTIFLLVLAACTAQSQVEVGIRGGVAFSKQKFDNYSFPPHLSNHIEGIEVGATLNWFFLRSFFLQPELTFIQKGGIISFHTLKINNVEAAALFGYERKCEKLSLFVSSGAFVDRVLNIARGSTGNSTPDREIEVFNWGWGLMYGGGAAIPIGNGWIGLAGRFRHSLSSFRRISYFADLGGNPETPFIVNYKNRGWSINLYYKIDIP